VIFFLFSAASFESLKFFKKDPRGISSTMSVTNKNPKDVAKALRRNKEVRNEHEELLVALMQPLSTTNIKGQFKVSNRSALMRELHFAVFGNENVNRTDLRYLNGALSSTDGLKPSKKFLKWIVEMISELIRLHQVEQARSAAPLPRQRVVNILIPIGGINASCPVCLEQFGVGDRTLSCKTCANHMHQECFERWEQSRAHRATCVCCRGPM
jgi:hypothetical protein